MQEQGVSPLTMVVDLTTITTVTRGLASLIFGQEGGFVANQALRIAGLADALAEIVPAVEARFAADGTIDDLERQVLNDLRACAVEAEEQNGLIVYALGLFRAKATNRRLREMRRDLQSIGMELEPLPAA